jgi:hypothetical protein
MLVWGIYSNFGLLSVNIKNTTLLPFPLIVIIGYIPVILFCANLTYIRAITQCFAMYHENIQEKRRDIIPALNVYTTE